MTKKKPPEEHKPDGRPTKYRAKYHCEQAFKFAVLGMQDTEIAGYFELSEAGFNNWKVKYPKFLEAIRAGREPANSAVADSLRQRALGFEWLEEVPTKVKRIEYDPDTGKKTAEFEEVVITKVKRTVPPDTNAISLYLRNRKSIYWRDKVEIETTDVTTKADRIKAARDRAAAAKQIIGDDDEKA